MSAENLLKANFSVKAQVSAEPVIADPKAEFRKKAIESVGGSMVWTERQTLFWNGQDEPAAEK